MATNAYTHYNPSGVNSPFMELPEHIEGIIDVRTLADIHNFLRQSENDDDQDLANWVGKEYLYEPLIDEGRQIRTTEGFAKLDKAYRRVRQLTGKAQDKWPFFDRNWKTMPSTMVKNLSLGESSPVVSNTKAKTLDGSSGARLAPTDQSPGNYHHETPQPLKLQVPFGNKQPKKRISRPQLASQTRSSTAPPSGEEGTQSGVSAQARKQPSSGRLAQSATSTPHRNLRPDRLSFDEDTPKIDEDIDGLSSSVATATSNLQQDSDKTKTRSSNAEFRLKLQDSPASQAPNRRMDVSIPTGEREDHAKHSNPAETTKSAASNKESTSDSEGKSDQKTEASDGTSDESVPESENISSNGAADQLDDELEHTNSQPATATNAAKEGPTDRIPFSILAAEAEAVPSNLDRLPPGVLRKNKRKSESIAQRGQVKRSRGSRGGIIGRPRKSEQIGVASGHEASEVAEEIAILDNQTKPVSTPPRMSTRQITRRSVAATTPESSPENSAAADASEKEKQRLPNGDDKTTISDEESKDGESKVLSDVLVKSPTTQTVEKKTNGRPRKKAQQESAASNAISAKKTVKNKASASKSQNPPPATVSAMMKQNKIINGVKPHTKTLKTKSRASNGVPKPLSNGDDSTAVPGSVEFFARIHSRTGTSELPLSDHYLSSDVEIIRRYAEWQQEGGDASVPFEVFKKIFAFAATPTPLTK